MDASAHDESLGDPPVASNGAGLRGPAQAFLRARTRDDPVPVAEPDPGAGDAVLFPELVDPRAQAGELGRRLGVVALRENVPKLRAPLGRALDVSTDVPK